MPVSEKTRRAMQEVGLTDYEIKVYFALLENGAMIASGVSSNAEVPYSKVYEVLGSLEKKGWIETQGGRPTKYYPKAPSTALETMRLRIDSARRRNEEQVLSDLMTIYEKKEVRERPDIWIVRGEFNIIAKVKEVLTHCERELQIATPFVPDELAEMILPLLAGIRGRGGSALMMTTKETPTSLLRRLAELSEVRVREQMFGGGVISDAREVIILLAEESERGLGLAIWSEHSGLARFAKNYFDYLWNEADPFRV